QHHRYEQGQHGAAPGQLLPVDARQEGGQDATADVGQQPREALAEGHERAALLGPGQVDADQLEQVVAALAAVDVGQLFGVEVHVHQTQDTALLVHHREGEQLVQDEELARLQDGGGPGDGDDLAHHDFSDRRLGRAEQQATGGHDTPEPAVVVGDVEVDDA